MRRASTRFATKLVLPTPGLPLVMANTGARRRRPARNRPSTPIQGGDSSIGLELIIEFAPAQKHIYENFRHCIFQITGKILPQRYVREWIIRGQGHVDQWNEVAALVQFRE